MRLDKMVLFVVLTGLLGCSSSDASPNNDGVGAGGTGGGGDGGTGGQAGAGGSTPGGNCASHNSDDVAAACDTLASASCAHYARCSNTLSYYKSQGDCVAVEKAACMNVAGLPGTSLTPGMIWLATQAFSTETCELQDVSADTSCPATGSLADGAACAGSFQCSSGYCKPGFGFYGCGTCTALAAESGACETNADCSSGLWCSSGSCKTTTPAGASCATTSECVNGSLCQGGKCTPTGMYMAKAGDSCQVGWECVQGLDCVMGKCGEPEFAADGESCGVASTCGNDLICENGKCTAYVPGGACANNSTCAMGQYCNSSGKCVDQGGLGGACAINGLDDDCLLGLTCVDHKCGLIDATVCP